MLAEAIEVIISQYIYQAIMLYALNFYSDVCQLFFNKTRGKEFIKCCHQPKQVYGKGMGNAAETKSQR